MSADDVAAALARDEPEELLHLAIALSLDPPEETAQGLAEATCLRLARHAHPHVRGNAVLGFGHQARTLGEFRRPEDVRAAVAAGLADPDEYVRGQAHAAADDIAHFLGLPRLSAGD